MKKKILAISLAISAFALVLSASTMAYFTDKTDTITNTFTVGKVHITLTEPEADDWALDENQNPKMVVMPSGAYKKTPTIKVEDDSQRAWVFTKVQLSSKEAFANMVVKDNNLTDISEATDEQLIAGFKKILTGMSSAWVFADIDAENATATMMYKYSLAPGKIVKVFTGVKIPSNLSNEDVADGSFDNATIKVSAYAIQYKGVTSENAFSEAQNAGLFETDGSGE